MTERVAPTRTAKRRRETQLEPEGGSGQQVFSLLSVPNYLLYILFNKLSSSKGTVGSGSQNSDAYNLALTCRRFHDYYRCTFAVALDVSGQRNVTFDVLLRALERLPRVHTIHCANCRWDRSSVQRIFAGIRREKASIQSRALAIKSLNLRDVGVFDDDMAPPAFVRRIVETYRSLEHLVLSDTDSVDDDVVAAIAEHLQTSLQTLDLHFTDVSDVGGTQVGSLCHLKSLSLSNCRNLTDVTFRALGALEELEELDLSCAHISDTVACDTLPNFRKLLVLNLQSCVYITSAILPILPRSLVELILNFSGALDEDIQPSAFELMPSLTKLEGCGCHGVNDMSFLAPIASRLQVLCLSGVGASDSEAAYWISQMPDLVRLDLSESAVSDETARAISCLRHVSYAQLLLTQIGNDGVRALSQGIACWQCQSLETVNLRDCPNISDAGAVASLRYEISRKGCGSILL